MKNKTDGLCKKTTVCVVLANCPTSLLTVQKSIRSEHFGRLAFICTFGENNVRKEQWMTS